MDSVKYIGMDVHKESISIAVRNGAGKIVMESLIETKASMILQFIDGLRGDVHVTFEEGTSAAWLYDLLKGGTRGSNEPISAVLHQGQIQENWLVPAAKKAGLGQIGWHTFRHSHSTLLHALGVDLKVQQELLRHADVRTTMNIYTQAVPKALREANSKIVRLVLPAQVA